MYKPVIAIDIDEVLSPFVYGLAAWHNQQYGTTYQLEDFQTYAFHQIWGGDRDSAIAKSCQYFENREPVLPLPDAMRVLSRLRQDYELIVVTSRMLSHQTHTETWIEQHFPRIFQKILLCNHWSKNNNEPVIKKSTACLSHGARYLIDDLPHYVAEVAAEGLTGLLFGQYPWNRQALTHPQIHRVADWQAVENYFYS